LEDSDLHKLNERIQAMAMNDFMRGPKIPEDDFDQFKQQLELDIRQCYLLICEKNAEAKVCMKSSPISCSVPSIAVSKRVMKPELKSRAKTILDGWSGSQKYLDGGTGT